MGNEEAKNTITTFLNRIQAGSTDGLKEVTRKFEVREQAESPEFRVAEQGNRRQFSRFVPAAPAMACGHIRR
jgi:hypothetical protein